MATEHKIARLGAALSVAFAAAAPARADIVLVPSTPEARATAAAAAAPPPRAGGEADGIRRRGAARAVGFGEGVPLSFAVRQIVPARVRVLYGDGVDRDAAVTWSGGVVWHEALRAAVEPLGLRVVVGPGRVSIVED